MNEVITYLLVAMAATFLPSPTDPINFYLQNWLYKRKQSRAAFEWWQIFSWYILDSLWFGFLIIIVLLFNIQNLPPVNALTTVATIIGIGAVISIIWRFMRKRR